MSKSNSKTKTVAQGILAYPHLFEPKAAMGSGEEKYSACIIIRKDDPETLKRVHAAIEAAKEVGREKKFGGKIPPNLRLPLRDGDIERPDSPEFKNAYYINASCKNQPQVVDRHVQPILDPMQVYAGCTVNMSINFYCYSVNGNRGVGAGLGNVQFVADGERLSGRASASADIEDLGSDLSDDELPDYLR